MSALPTSSSPGHAPADASLLLRVHAERAWLGSELLAVVRQLEAPAALKAGQFHAALAYLEVAWLEATRRAAETDAAHERLERAPDRDALPLVEQALRYHRSLRLMRAALEARVEPFLGGSPDAVAPTSA
jgi:hypothetical protein